jgi:hypothetical protein
MQDKAARSRRLDVLPGDGEASIREVWLERPKRVGSGSPA